MYAHLAFLMAVALIVTSAAGGTVVLPDVPPYLWYYGCGPTSAGMIIGFWDGNGFPNLITAGDGSNSWDVNQQGVKDMIASAGHIRDYVPKPDRVPTPEDPYHADDCVADFMRASRGTLNAGDSYETLQWLGLTGYSVFRGYYGAEARFLYYSGVWGELVSAIDAGRPAELFVDTNADGTPDHFVAAVGYDDTPGSARYACYNTYDGAVHWYSFAACQGGRSYGVRSGTFFRISLAGDADRDGDVDFLDYQALEVNFGTTVGATWQMGDFNGDGRADFKDYQALEANFGHGVPEPAALPLLIAGGLAGVSRPNRRGKAFGAGMRCGGRAT